MTLALSESPLDKKSHNVRNFRSGRPELDNWLRSPAFKAQEIGTARTFVLTPQSGEGKVPVMAYYSLASAGVAVDDLPEDVKQLLPRHPVPACLIARLAVDDRYKGQGYGALMVLRAWRLVIAATDHIGINMVIVDAIDEAAANFYRKCGFIRIPSDPHRLYIGVHDITKQVDMLGATGQ